MSITDVTIAFFGSMLGECLCRGLVGTSRGIDWKCHRSQPSEWLLLIMPD
jgi:hypothetical protein